MQPSIIVVSGTNYNLFQAPAIKQKTLMTLISARVALNSGTAGRDITVPLLKGVLLSTPEPVLDQISDIVLWKCIQSGGDSLTTVDNFQGGMNDYFTLLAEAIMVNLSDFFTWLDEERRAGLTENPPAEAEKNQ
jgi:hypothetical protein